MSFPCDHSLTPSDAAYFRAVSVQAPAPILFRWLFQLRVASYSYDWIDNGGRKSPRELIPGLDQREIGQSMCTIFQYPPGFTGAVMRTWVPRGDFLMMRKQLLTLKHLAERQF